MRNSKPSPSGFLGAKHGRSVCGIGLDFKVVGLGFSVPAEWRFRVQCVRFQGLLLGRSVVPLCPFLLSLFRMEVHSYLEDHGT